VANSALDGVDDFNTKVIEEFRANEGRVGGSLAGLKVILVHHTGARSGTERVTPLMYLPWNEGRYLVLATNGGSPKHPDWAYNLRADPRITVEVGTRAFPVLAEELDAAARAEAWPEVVAQSPVVGEIQTRLTRRIPLFLLTPQD
jgi:deazaflavin-dependent oxidoreductase (nitroreductase family)